MNPLLVRYGPYLIAILALIGIGLWGGWHFGAAGWKTRYETLSAEDWQSRAQRAEAALAAVQEQLKDAHDTISRNTGIYNDYEQKLAATAAERDNWHAALDRMRAAQARPAATGGDPVSEADCRCAAVEARATSELAECQGVLVESITEDSDNGDQLDALSAEVSRQR